MEHLPPHYRLFLDALIAAVLMMIAGLTLFVFFQAPADSHSVTHLNPVIRLPRIFQIPVIVEVSGLVTNVDLREGSRVHTGDVLLQLDTHELLTKKQALERLIHFSEDHHVTTSKLYRELEKVRLDLGRRAITSSAEGRIIFAIPVEPGDAIKRGSAIAIQVIESQHAGYSLRPSMHR